MLPIFGFVCVHREPLAEGPAAEAEWLASCAATGRAAAHLWQGRPGLVVPRKLAAEPGWAEASVRHGAQLRLSGGGTVPQGPGLWNLSLLWPAPSSTPTDTERLYAALCANLADALRRLGLQARPQSVPGAFCDGRWNLAVGGRKLVGTAQAWRRVAGVPLVLAQAMIVVSADPQSVTAQANAFEATLGSGRRYDPAALTSVARETGDPAIEARALAVLAEQFAHRLPPRVAKEAVNGVA
jgi:lipoate-protein ligase A